MPLETLDEFRYPKIKLAGYTRLSPSENDYEALRR